MKFARNYVAAALCLAILAQPAGAWAADTITDADRTLPGGRAVEVLVGQAEIRANIAPSNAGAAAGSYGLFGALAGALVQTAIDSKNSKKAESAITPIRDALSKFDADGLALATTRTAIGKIDWLHTDDVGFSKDTSPAGESRVLDAAKSSQVAFVSYSYEMTPNFSSVEVIATIFLADKALHPGDTKPEDRVRSRNMIYQSTARSVVILPGPIGKPAENSARWAADGGRLIKQGLAQGFGTLETLIPRLLAVTEGDIKLYRKNKRGGFDDFSGKTIEREGDHALFWADGFINIDPLAPQSADPAKLAAPPTDTTTSVPIAPPAQP